MEPPPCKGICAIMHYFLRGPGPGSAVFIAQCAAVTIASSGPLKQDADWRGSVSWPSLAGVM